MNTLRLAFLIIFFSSIISGCTDRSEKSTYVEDSTQIHAENNCKDCHQQQVRSWEHSDHAKAMQIASSESVLGDFNNQKISLNESVAKFFIKNGQYWTTLENGEGQYQNYKIEFAFGHRPIQQYLIKTPKGKYQTLPFTWDNRPYKDGGQRWFQLNDGEHSDPNNRLHWTQPLQNWNGMCADCHSVGIKRNYDKAKDEFQTTWGSDNVSCAACHKPNTLHLSQPTTKREQENWQFINGKNTAHWVGKEWNGIERSNHEINTCAACHSRRSPLTDGFSVNDNFLDVFSPRLITQPEYFADGQINDEVYVWGSFLQSKMYQNGVICSDCHKSHSLELRAQGNELCAQCHKVQVFDTPEHHHHEMESTGAQCMSCHMMGQTYMGVDDRKDHSFRIPRPHLTKTTGSPNACTSCHKDKKTDWAVTQINKWTGLEISQSVHYGQIFSDIQTNKKETHKALISMISNPDTPVIIRASGYALLDSNAQNIKTLSSGLNASEPLIRLGAVRGAYGNPNARELLLPLLSDTYRAVRVEVIRSLALTDTAILPQQYHSAYQRAEQEFLQAQDQAAWRGESRMNIGMRFQQIGMEQEAIEAYLASTQLDPYFAPSYVNLANAYKDKGFDAKGGEWLRQGLLKMPNDPDLNFALALYLIRQAQGNDALTYLEKAVIYAPGNARYSYVYGVALYDMGQPAKAISILTKALSYSPGNENIIHYLMTINIAQKNYPDALIYAEKLISLYPNNASLRKQVAKIKTELRTNE